MVAEVHPDLSSSPTLSHHSLLGFDLNTDTFLTATNLNTDLDNYSSDITTSNFTALHEDSLLFLHTLVPIVLSNTITIRGLPDTISNALRGLSGDLSRLSPRVLGLAHRLFSILKVAIAHKPLAKI